MLSIFKVIDHCVTQKCSPMKSRRETLVCPRPTFTRNTKGFHLFNCLASDVNTLIYVWLMVKRGFFQLYGPTSPVCESVYQRDPTGLYLRPTVVRLSG